MVAAAIRLIFFVGMVRGDSLNYAHAAHLLSQGVTDLGDWDGVARPGTYGPVALLYALFGPSQWTAHAFPFLASLTTILFVFLLGRQVANERAGLIAALLWAFFPLDVLLAGWLLPDAAVATLLSGALYFWLKGVTQERWQNRSSLLGLALIIAAIAVKPVAIMGLFAAAGLLVSARWQNVAGFASRLFNRLAGENRKAILVASILVALLGFGWYASIQPYPFLVTMAKTSSDLSAFFFSGFTELEISNLRLDFSGLLIFFAPLYLISAVWAMREGSRPMRQMLLWVAILFFYYEWGTINLDPLFYVALQPFQEARTMLFIIAPITVIAGAYLDAFFPEQSGSSIIAGVTLLGLGAAWSLRAVHWSAVPEWLSLATILVVTLSVLSLNVAREGSQRTRLILGSSLLISLCIASLRPAAPYHASWYWDRTERVELLREAAQILDDGSDMPIAVNGRGNAMTLNYISNFKLGFDWVGDGRVDGARIQETGSAGAESYWLITFGEESAEQPAELLTKLEGRYGGQLSIWRVH